jgi:hypothetical protein
MRIGRRSRAAVAALMMTASAASATAQARWEAPPICARSAAEAFERLGPPARHWSDEDGAVRYRDYPSARFGHWARHEVRAEVGEGRVDVIVRDTGGIEFIREQLLRDHPGIACTTRTVTWPPGLDSEPDPYGDDDYVLDTPVDGDYWPEPGPGGGEDAGLPVPRLEPPREVSLTDCAWTAPAEQREGLMRIEVREGYDDLFYRFGRPETGHWLEISCSHRGPLPYGWEYRWRDDWWN